MTEQKEYYMTRKVLFEIVKQMRFREGAYLQKMPHEKYVGFAVRQINAWNIELTLKNFERFDFFKLPLNLYYSLAKYKQIPMASFEPTERKADYAKWAQEWKSQFIGMDFAFDIDNEGLKKAWEDAKKIKQFFDERNIPYTIAFSGSKGFHLEIPQENILDIKEPDEWLLAYQTLVSLIKKKLKVKSLDDTITDMKRIFKTKYSWDVKSGLICLPLNDTQFEEFNIEMAKPENVLALPNLGFRGLLLRNPNNKIQFYDFIKSIK